MFSPELAPSTLKQYTSTITRLNGGTPPKNAGFLKDTNKIETMLEKYSPNSKKTFYITIVSYLKDKKIPKKTLQYYTSKMVESNKFFFEHSSERTPKQVANWMSWDEVLAVHEKMKAELPKKPNETNLDYLVLSLFTLQPPRRAKDYQLMKVVPEYHPVLPTDYNYLDWKHQKYYFNNYKTKGAYGQQVVDVTPEMTLVLKKFFKPKKDSFFLLFKELPTNGITRILNKVFGKNVSVSMIRNIFSTQTAKPIIEHIEDIATKMGTSSRMLKGVYSKND
jgi:hypothetical protein